MQGRKGLEEPAEEAGGHEEAREEAGVRLEEPVDVEARALRCLELVALVVGHVDLDKPDLARTRASLRIVGAFERSGSPVDARVQNSSLGVCWGAFDVVLECA